MKIQCDVCEKEKAIVFCPADEAALCHGCDCSIHLANKLATKHARFSVHYPSSKESPLCDICQVLFPFFFLPPTFDFRGNPKNWTYPSLLNFLIFWLQERCAYLFCQEDRVILCRECDLPIHSSNEHTQKHNRFLLTGVKLSASSLHPASSSSIKGSDAVNDSEALKRARSVSNENFTSSPSIGNYSSLASPTNCRVEDNLVSDTASVSTSSISEYLIETIPGFCFEELLDSWCFNSTS